MTNFQRNCFYWWNLRLPERNNKKWGTENLDAAALEKMGFTVSGLVANKTYKALGLSDAFVLNEDEQARRVGQLFLGLAKAFLFDSSESSIYGYAVIMLNK